MAAALVIRREMSVRVADWVPLLAGSTSEGVFAILPVVVFARKWVIVRLVPGVVRLLWLARRVHLISAVN